MDSQQTTDRSRVALAIAVIVAIAVVAVAGYLLGHAPVQSLKDQLDRVRLSEADVAADRTDEQQRDDETHLDAVRVLLVEGLAEIEGHSRVIASRIAAGSYVLGAFETCEDLLGQNAPRCELLVEVLTEPAYPGDPGYIPDPADRDIRSISEEFEPLLDGICTRDAWPYRSGSAEFQQVAEACRSYDSMVGRLLAGD